MLDSPSAWIALVNDERQWLLMDLGSPQLVAGVVTQARADQYLGAMALYIWMET